MSLWHEENECGTVCCIGGCAVAMWPETFSPSCYDWVKAAHILGLDTLDGEDLFYPNSSVGGNKAWSEYTPSDAAKVIRHLIETGHVDWSIVE